MNIDLPLPEPEQTPKALPPGMNAAVVLAAENVYRILRHHNLNHVEGLGVLLAVARAVVDESGQTLPMVALLMNNVLRQFPEAVQLKTAKELRVDPSNIQIVGPTEN